MTRMTRWASLAGEDATIGSDAAGWWAGERVGGGGGAVCVRGIYQAILAIFWAKHKKVLLGEGRVRLNRGLRGRKGASSHLITPSSDVCDNNKTNPRYSPKLKFPI
jgi:hypothetical protein